MSLCDFWNTTPMEFREICEAWAEERQADYRDNWVRDRLMTSIAVQPHCKNRITPEQLLPLPWEKKNKVRPTATALTPEQRKADFEEAIKGMNHGQ